MDGKWPRDCDKQLQEQSITLQILHCRNNNKEREEQDNIQQPINNIKTSARILKEQPLNKPLMHKIHIKERAGRNRKILRQLICKINIQSL